MPWRSQVRGAWACGTAKSVRQQPEISDGGLNPSILVIIIEAVGDAFLLTIQIRIIKN